jgi:ankyrin repeat protein
MQLMLVVLGVVIVSGLLGVAVYRRKRRAAMAAGQCLLIATEAGDLEQMQALLTRRADMRVTNAQGWTPLHVAAAGGQVEVVELLLAHGADVNATSNIGATPLDNAMTYSRSRTVADLLRQHGAEGHTDWDTIF